MQIKIFGYKIYCKRNFLDLRSCKKKMKIKKINFRVLPVRPEVTPIQTKKSEISLRQCFCLGTGNKQTELPNKKM